MDQNGVTPEQVEFTDEGLVFDIALHSRGRIEKSRARDRVRVPKKWPKRPCRSIEKIVVTEDVVGELLGPPKFPKDERLKENQVGITTGLAWTQAGEVLFVEALKMKGKGGLILTGHHDVMKELHRRPCLTPKLTPKSFLLWN